MRKEIDGIYADRVDRTVEFMETGVKNKKKNILIRMLEWIVRGNKKAAESGEFCGS